MNSVTKLRIRFNECDATGFAFNGNYFIWMQEGAGDLINAAGVDLVKLAEGNQTMMAVHLSCDYKRPVRFRDVIEIRSQVTKVSKSSLYIKYEIYQGRHLVAVGRTVHVSINIKTKAITPIPQEIKTKLLAFQEAD